MREQGGVASDSLGFCMRMEGALMLGATTGSSAIDSLGLWTSEFLLHVSLSFDGWKTPRLLLNASQLACPCASPPLPEQGSPPRETWDVLFPHLISATTAYGTPRPLAIGFHPPLEVLESCWQIPEDLP